MRHPHSMRLLANFYTGCFIPATLAAIALEALAVWLGWGDVPAGALGLVTLGSVGYFLALVWWAAAGRVEAFDRETALAWPWAWLMGLRRYQAMPECCDPLCAWGHDWQARWPRLTHTRAALVAGIRATLRELLTERATEQTREGWWGDDAA